MACCRRRPENRAWEQDAGGLQADPPPLTFGGKEEGQVDSKVGVSIPQSALIPFLSLAAVPPQSELLDFLLTLEQISWIHIWTDFNGMNEWEEFKGARRSVCGAICSKGLLSAHPRRDFGERREADAQTPADKREFMKWFAVGTTRERLWGRIRYFVPSFALSISDSLISDITSHSQILTSVEKACIFTCLPHRHTDKVQNVPAVPQVCVCMEKKSIGNNLQEAFHREDDEEDILQTFLKKQNKNKTKHEK